MSNNGKPIIDTLIAEESMLATDAHGTTAFAPTSNGFADLDNG